MRVETGIPMSDWRSIAAAAQRAEAIGFDGITMPEIANDPFMPLAFAALATERIQLGTAIAVAFARSPMMVANTAWDLQLNSRGRFGLGLGPQVKGHNERRFSVPWSAPVPRLREYIEALDPDARRTMHRLKVLCSLSCNALAASVVFIAIDALAGRRHRARGLRPCDGADRGRVSGASSPADPAVAVAAPVHRARPAEPARSGAA